MNKKLNIRELVKIALLYAVSAFLSLLFAKWVKTPVIFWIPTSLSICYAIIYKKRAIGAIILGAALIITLGLLNLGLFKFSLTSTAILFISDIIVGTLFALYFKNRIPFLNYLDDLKKFAIAVGISTLAQTIFITALFQLFSVYPEINLALKLQLLFSSIAVTAFSITPLLLATYSTPKRTNEKIVILDYFILIVLALAPNIIDLTKITDGINFLPVQLIVIALLVIYSVNQKFERTTLIIFLLISSLIISSSLNRNFFNLFSIPYNIISAQYISILLSLFIITLSAVLNERNNALQSLNESLQNTQNEVSRQTEIFRELNDKLLFEVEKRGLIEKELNLSKKLLTESQEIANITSWEYDLKEKTIRWSESASRILGINSTQVSAFSMEKYLERIHPEDKRAFLNDISKASENTRDINLEVRYQLNNQYRHFLIRGRSFDDNNGIERIVGVLSDITDWKEAQVALSEKETRYRALFETNIDPVILIDASTKTIIDVNTAFEKLYEYSKSEIIGTPYINISAQEYETHQALDITLQKGFYRVPTRVHRKKSGEEFYVEGHFVKFLSGQNPQIFAVLRDNTSRKNYEFKLSERELKFRLFFESNLIGMAETTVYKTWITFNTKLCQILGYKPEELEKITWDLITHPDDLEFEIKQFNNILQRKTDSYTLEKRFVKKDGSTVFCNVAVKAIKDNNGTITHLVKLIEDITLRKKAENALLESQTRLRKAQQIAHLGVCRLSMYSGYLDVSEEAFTILEWNKDNAPFKLDNFIYAIHPSDRDELKSIIARLKSGETKEENLETRFLNSTGDISYLSVNIGVSQDSNNKITDLLITFADITTSKLAEASLKEANAMKDQLFSVISHDLRGPIGSMEQMLSLYIDSADTLDKDSKEEIIKLLHNTSRESYNLLENLLEWGRSQRQTTLKPIQIDVRSTADETITLLSGMASSKDIKIELNIDKDCQVFVDLMMFKTILRNLISNAIKFTPTGGKITLKCKTQDKLCQIELSDSGIGIPADKIELLFDDSKVFSTSGTNSEKGTGLGLKLVKRFVDKNGGTIQVLSEQGKGTTFTITLPATETI